MYNIHRGTIRWQIHYFLSDGNSNVCSSFHHMQDIRKTRKKNFDLGNEGQSQVEERNLRLSTGNVQFHVGVEFFSEFLVTWEYTIL